MKTLIQTWIPISFQMKMLGKQKAPNLPVLILMIVIATEKDYIKKNGITAFISTHPLVIEVVETSIRVC